MIQIKENWKANILSSKDSTGCFSLGDTVSSVRLAGESWFAVALVMVEVLATFRLSEYSTEERLRLLLTVAVSSAAGSSFINSCWVDSTFSTWRLMLHQQIYLEGTSYCENHYDCSPRPETVQCPSILMPRTCLKVICYMINQMGCTAWHIGQHQCLEFKGSLVQIPVRALSLRTTFRLIRFSQLKLSEMNST